MKSESKTVKSGSLALKMTTTKQLRVKINCELSCSDCIHKCSSTYAEDDFHVGYGVDYCSKADREFWSEEDYEICAMFEEKNIIFADEDGESNSQDELLPFGNDL